MMEQTGILEFWKNGLYNSIHLYDNPDVAKNRDLYCISNGSFEDGEVYIDEDEAESRRMSKAYYRQKLKAFGAETYYHQFEYPDGYKRTVEDSYFTDITQAIDCVLSFQAMKEKGDLCVWFAEGYENKEAREHFAKLGIEVRQNRLSLDEIMQEAGNKKAEKGPGHLSEKEYLRK